MNKSKLMMIAMLAVLTVGATACSNYNDTRGKGDAAVTDGYGHRKGNDSPKQVTNFPDGYANIATSCVAPGFRAFITTGTNKTGIPVIVADPKCSNYTDVSNLYK